MNDPLLTAGQFAKLARTTKRTVLWYDTKGILQPSATSESGYRLYHPQQILEFQIILLLRKLSFSLDEIEQHIKGGESLMSLFASKKDEITQEVRRLQQTLHNTETYYDNLMSTRLLVKPTTRHVPSFEIFYIDKTGPYAKIGSYCQELAAMFKSLPDRPTFLTIFDSWKYQPHAAKMKIGVIKGPGIELGPSARGVQSKIIPEYTSLSYIHHGSGALLSLLWIELGKYRRQNNIKTASHLDFAELELYLHDETNEALTEDNFCFEMHLPVCMSPEVPDMQ